MLLDDRVERVLKTIELNHRSKTYKKLAEAIQDCHRCCSDCEKQMKKNNNSPAWVLKLNYEQIILSTRLDEAEKKLNLPPFVDVSDVNISARRFSR